MEENNIVGKIYGLVFHEIYRHIYQIVSHFMPNMQEAVNLQSKVIFL